MSCSHRRAIILDDESGIRSLMGKVLSRCGYTVVPYSSPTEATIFDHPENCPLATGHAELFDESPTCAELIITDLDMPCINGIEYIRKIRKVGCRVRYVAMMSGNWSESDIAEAEALGCKVFSKPFNVREMQDWVSSLTYEEVAS